MNDPDDDLPNIPQFTYPDDPDDPGDPDDYVDPDDPPDPDPHSIVEQPSQQNRGKIMYILEVHMLIP